MKFLSAILITLLVSNTAMSMGSKKPTTPKPTTPTTQVPTPTIPAPTIPAPTPTGCDIVDPGSIDYALEFVSNKYTTQVRMTRVKKLASSALVVMNSDAFKKRVLESWYKGKAQFADTKDSNETIYQKIRASAEVFNKCKNYKVELQYQWDSNSGKVLGWTYASVKTVWFNYKNFDPRADSGIVGTICHEHMHKIGYGHSSAKSYASVPYAVGTICSEIYLEMKKNGQILN